MSSSKGDLDTRNTTFRVGKVEKIEHSADKSAEHSTATAPAVDSPEARQLQFSD